MKVLNKIEIYDPSKEEIIVDGQPMYVCCICGRANFKKVKAYGHTYCNKHYKQHKKGEIKDPSPRTRFDRNEIRIDGDVAYVCLYNSDFSIKGLCKIDADDVEKIRYTKWTESWGYAYYKGTRTTKGYHMHRLIMGTIEQKDVYVDHINGDRLDNRKVNLRLVNKSQNAMNMKTARGVDHHGDTYYARIKIHQKAINLGSYKIEEEAYYARWYAETILFGEYQYKGKVEPDIPQERKKQIQEYIDKKVQRLQLSVEVNQNNGDSTRNSPLPY